MDIGIISTRYAKTLLRFSSEKKEEDAVCQEMATLAQSFRKVPALQQALLNPVLSDGQKEELLISAAVGKAAPTDSTRSFLHLVVQNKRADLMTFIASSFVELYNKSKKLIRGRLIVPAEVSESTATKLRNMVESRTKSKVEFTTEIDPSLGGGFVLEYDTYRLDASLKTQIAKIRRELV